MAKTVTHEDFLSLKAEKGLPFTPKSEDTRKRKFPTNGFRGAFIIRVGEKPLHKDLKKATQKGNNYLERLTESNKDKGIVMVRRERLNKGSSSFAFSLIGDYTKPKRTRRVRQVIKQTAKGNKIVIAQKAETIHANVSLSIGLKSGRLPAWYR